jgi:outer membrane protein OmpA-like peptidoglycan-associated protein
MKALLTFDFDSSALTSTAKTNLDKLAQVLTNNPDTNINIYGHTDSKGSDSYNMSLSERRANAVKAYLVGKGIASNRLFALGEGESMPVATNDTEEGRAKNRRVEFAITANEKMINDAQKGNNYLTYKYFRE